MKVTDFPDTDTRVANFADRRIAQTHDLGENVVIELDKQGRLVSMTIERAKQTHT